MGVQYFVSDKDGFSAGKRARESCAYLLRTMENAYVIEESDPLSMRKENFHRGMDTGSPRRGCVPKWGLQLAGQPGSAIRSIVVTSHCQLPILDHSSPNAS